MTTSLPTIEQEAAQFALALRDLGHLSAKPTGEQIEKASELFQSRHGYCPATSEDLSKLIRQRIGQIVALALVDEPMQQSFAPPSPNTKAGKLIKEAKAEERRLATE